MRCRKKIGEMLVDAGYIAQSNLENLLDEQHSSQMKLGEFLICRNVIREDEFVELLSRQLHINRYSVERYPVTTQLAGILDINLVNRHETIPIEQQERGLTVAMKDPLNFGAIDTVEEILDCRVTTVICTSTEYEDLLREIYGLSSGMEKIVNESCEDEITISSEESNADEVQVSSLIDMAEGAPAVKMVNWMISQAVRDGASDIHISPEKTSIQLRFRIDGQLQEMSPPPRPMMLPITSRVKILANMDLAQSRIPQDGRFSAKIDGRDINVRASTVPTTEGENIVLRLLDMSGRNYTLNDLGMREDERKVIDDVIVKPHGLVLSTGPTGSGKSTSLYAILQELNKPNVNIITVEDPVEYRVKGIRQLQLNTRAGMSFASGLRSILRQDPDIIMIGEIRDAETAQIAAQASLTGHKVFSTIHTNSAAGAIVRLQDMGLEPFIIASILLTSFAQRLVRTVCPKCAEPFIPKDHILNEWGVETLDGTNFLRGTGCSHCMHTGYKGRHGIYEILPINSTVQEMIVQRKSSDAITKMACEAGILRTLKQDALDKVINGITTFEEATRAVMT